MLRVYFDPWNSVSRSVTAATFGIQALPIVARYEGGIEVARVTGAHDADELKRQIAPQ
jgi:thioredoxin-like negative regulator of GroEL